MSLNPRKLKEWARKKAVTIPALDSFSLWHVERYDRRLISRLSIEAGSPIDQADDLERLVSEEVIDHTEAWPGRQRYVVQAQDEAGDALAEFAFSMTAATPSAAALLTQPTPEMEAAYGGMIGANFSSPDTPIVFQLMRHNEALLRLVVEMSTGQAERDRKIIAQQQRSIDKANAKRFEVVELLEEMYCRRQERNLSQARHEADVRRKQELLSALTNTVVPSIAEALRRRFGIDTPGEGVDNTQPHESDSETTEQSSKQFFHTLPQQLQELIRSLSPEDMQELISIFTASDTPPPPDSAPSSSCAN